MIEKDRPKERWLDRFVRGQGWLDPVADFAQKLVGGTYSVLGRPGVLLRNLMHGTMPLGHPLHPALTDVPLGAWTVGVLADWLFVVTGRIPAVAGDLALAVGLAGALLAVVTGYTDFHDTFGHERRTAILHGGTMTIVVIVDLVSLGMRLWAGNARIAAIVLSTIAWIAVLTAAYIGGHLSFGMGTAVNHNAFADGPADFVRVGVREDFQEGQMKRVDAGGLPVVIVRRTGLLYAMGAVCSHAGGPLDEGKLEGNVVTCPWHASRFCFDNGRVMGGPATFDQPPLEVREAGGIVEVKLVHPLH